MAANMSFFVIFIITLLNLQTYTLAQNTTVAPATTSAVPQTTTPSSIPSAFEINTDLAQCTCDLTANACDVNCCCDVECDDSDRLAFSQCVDEYTPADSQVCFQSNIILINNSPYVVNTTVPGLFCIQKDNYEERNYLNIPDIVNTTEVFDEYVSKYGRTSFKPNNQDDTINTEFYKSGDPIYTVYEGNTTGLLGQPAPLTAGTCTDRNPAAFLYNLHLECVREIADLRQACMTQPYLNASNFYANFRVLPTPALLAPQEPEEGDNVTTTVAPPDITTGMPLTTMAAPPENVTTLFDLSLPIDASGPHVCIDVDGLNRTCDEVRPPQLSGDVCFNVMVETTYRIVHNGTAGIDSVAVTFTFRDVPVSGDSLSLTQAYTTSFSKPRESAPFRRSGNPGYRAGEPVMAGRLVEQTDINGDVSYAIELDGNRDNWLTIVTAARPDGRCSNDTDQRATVTFGDDMRSGCYIRASLNNYTSACSALQEAALRALRGYDNDETKYVATFADSAVEVVGDWVKVIDDEVPPAALPSGPATCRNLVTGMHVELVTAGVGALANPQSKVVGARYTYTTQDVTLQCIGPYCQPDNYAQEQVIEVVSSVGFVDVSSRAIDVSAAQPQITARLPEDFFYPFS